MKKINWILPLTLLGSVAATIPTISSCSCEWNGAIDLTHDVKYKYDKIKAEGKTFEDVCVLFREMMLEHPYVLSEILAHGFYKEYENITKDKQDLFLCEPEFKMKINNVNITKETDGDIRASFDMKIHRKLYMARRWSYKDTSWRDDDFIINIKANNVPIGYELNGTGLSLRLFDFNVLSMWKNWSMELSATGRAFDNSTGDKNLSFIFSGFEIVLNPSNIKNISHEITFSDLRVIFRILNKNCRIEYLDDIQGVEYLNIKNKEYKLPIKNRTFATQELELQLTGNIPEHMSPHSFAVAEKDEHINIRLDWNFEGRPNILTTLFYSNDRPIEIGEKCVFDIVIWYEKSSDEVPTNRFIIHDLVVEFVEG